MTVGANTDRYNLISCPQFAIALCCTALHNLGDEHRLQRHKHQYDTLHIIVEFPIVIIQYFLKKSTYTKDRLEDDQHEESYFVKLVPNGD